MMMSASQTRQTWVYHLHPEPSSTVDLTMNGQLYSTVAMPYPQMAAAHVLELTLGLVEGRQLSASDVKQLLNETAKVLASLSDRITQQ